MFLSQRDVRELQFAKASIATGWQILCNDMGVDPTEISQVLLGGSFGSYLTAASAVKIGLVPKLPLARIVSAGNVAGEGAKIAALSVTERAAANAVLDEVEYVELSGRTDFNDLFIDQLSFPAMTKVVVACGALALHIDAIAKRRGWDLEVRPLPPELHNRPGADPRGGRRGATARLVAYADCGTRGALDELPRLAGRRLLPALRRDGARAGTYYLTDFLVRSLRPRRLARARPRPASGAARRLLPALRARRLARPVTDRRAAREGGGRRAEARPAARSARDRRQRPRTCPRTTSPGGTSVLINELPRYEILDEHSMQELDRGWRRIVSELGIEFQHDEAKAALAAAGQRWRE